MAIQERYSPTVVSANTTITINSQSIGGFLAVTGGTITVVNAKGTTVLNAFPVAPGFYYPLPMIVGNTSATFTTAGGASGTLLI